MERDDLCLMITGDNRRRGLSRGGGCWRRDLVIHFVDDCYDAALYRVFQAQSWRENVAKPRWLWRSDSDET
jgi:hypothetical protein